MTMMSFGRRGAPADPLGYEFCEADYGPAALKFWTRRAFRSALYRYWPAGRHLGLRARRSRKNWDPTLKVLFTTGYAGIQAQNGDPDHAARQIIRKPYRSQELAAKIRETLDVDT